jgi:azurin/lysophospholipase L1-like esterase
MISRRLLPLFTLSALLAPATSRAEVKFEKGQHIAFIGGTFADWLQHEPTLETMLHRQFKEHDLTIRHLGFSGDEITQRSRSASFGSADEWLSKVQADTVVACFGFNESFAGDAGLPKFKTDLTKWIQETKQKQYNGKSAPQVVLISPIAWENMQSPDFTDGVAENARIQRYVEAMKTVAEAEQVSFINVFDASLGLYRESKNRLTVNGIHLTEEGYRALAPVLYQGFTHLKPISLEGTETLAEAIRDKNKQWLARYRTVDGFNVYGGRSKLAYPDKNTGRDVTNYEVMQQEMAVRDRLTENRDKVVWAAANGQRIRPEDSNLPPVATVTTNVAGKNPDGSHPFPSGEEMIAEIKTSDPNLRFTLFADEKQFPELVNPVQMNWDTQGRLWVAAWNHYPERPPQAETGDHLLVFEDTNGDGKADKMTKFYDQLNCPTGFQLVKDGVLVIQAPDVWILQDTNGDGKADRTKRIFAGLDSADSHHQTNAIAYEPGGALYFSDGVFHRSQCETYQGVFRNSDGGIYRYEPRTGKFNSHMLYGFANPHGRVFDRWGNDFITDATGNNTYFGPAGSGFLDAGQKHANLKQFWDRPSRPCPGTGMISSRHFPDDWQGDFLNLNVITFQGIYRVDMEEDGSGITGKSAPDLLWSSNNVFRPSCISTGPDGALYMCDWSNAIIGHMQHHLRDPNRDKQHGRIYKITYQGRDLLKPKKIHGASIPELLELLKEHEDGTRTLAKMELDQHPTDDVIAATKAWAAKQNDAHALCEALWVHQWQNRVDLALLERILQLPDAHARAAGARVLGYWRDRVPQALPMLKKLAPDSDPKVRLQAVRAASYFSTWEAADVALESLKHPQDYYLQYVFTETMRQLQQWWKPALLSGKAIAANNAPGMNHLLTTVSTSELLKLPRQPEILQAILRRNDTTETDRLAAASELSTAQGKSTTAVFLSAIQDGTSASGKAVDELTRLLLQQPTAELAKEQSTFTALLAPQSPAGDSTRRMAQAAIFLANGKIDEAWNSAKRLSDFLGAIPLVTDPVLRAAAAPKIRPLFDKLPEDIVTELQNESTRGRYIRISLPRNGTLTLSEVEVYSDGKNVGPKGKASQSSTSHDAGAQRAVDGNNSGRFGDGGQTHTAENELNPWWELDLGSELPLDKVVLWNRTEENGQFVSRLDGYTLTILDTAKKPTLELKQNPAAAQPMPHSLKGDPLANLQRLAIRALVSTNDAPETTFKTLANLVCAGKSRHAAAQGLMQLPRAVWDKTAAASTAENLLAWAKATSADVRTSQEFVELCQTASELAAVMPAEAATRLRRELRGLGVSVIVLKTVREQMRYDTARIVVEAGKPFELIFENEDAMPHNFVLCEPGSKDAIGTAALPMPPQAKDSKGRAFLPKDKRILAASKLLENGESERLNITAPTTPGSYDYVCTFPGHASIMWGRLEVTTDVDAYLQANPKPKQVPPTFALPGE